MIGKLANNLRKVLALVLVLAMVFCTIAFNNLSRVYAEGSENESTTSISISSTEGTEEGSITQSEPGGWR